MTLKEAQEWHFLADEQGNLDRPTVSSDLRVPGFVELDGEKLVWQQNSKGYCKSVRQSPKLLEEFIALVDAKPNKVISFARRWGVLAICEHGLPATHSYSPSLGCYNPRVDYDSRVFPFCTPQGFSVHNDGGWESLSAWQQFSEQARSLLSVAARLNQNELGLNSDWDVIQKRMEWGRRIGHDLIQQKLEVAAVVNEWLVLGNVRPALRWQWNANNYKVHFEVGLGDFSASTLFGALAGQLMLAVSSTGLAFCCSCQSYYKPPYRRAKSDQNNYCPSCGRKAALRDAQLRLRQKRKSQQI